MTTAPSEPTFTTEHSDDLHITVHAPFLTAHPEFLGPRPVVDPAEMWCTAKLPDDVWWRSAAIHESAHAVLAWTLGLTVKRLSLAQDRSLLKGGGALVGGTGDAQHYAIELLGAGFAQAQWLADQGYPNPELLRCVMELGASGDQKIVDSFVADGFVVDREQAGADARTILAGSRAKAALYALAELLLVERTMDGAHVARVLQEHRLSQRPLVPVWRPGRRLPLTAAPGNAAPSPRTRPALPGIEPAAAKSAPRSPLSRLTALAKRISAESRRRAARSPTIVSSSETASHEQSEHVLSQHHAQHGERLR